MSIEELRRLLEAARTTTATAAERVRAAVRAIDDAGDDADTAALAAELDAATQAHDDAAAEEDRAKRNLEAREKAERIIARGVAVPATPKGLRSERTYRPDGPHSFLADAFRAKVVGDASAAERIQRHAQEELQQRDVGTAAFAGLTVPQFLLDLAAPIARAGRPTANAVRSLPLPDRGMTLSISRITTGTAAAAQATENTAVQETDIDDTKLDVSVVTLAGQQDVSRQALERSEMVDQIVVADLVQAYHTLVGNAVINANGSGSYTGILNTGSIEAVTYTDASPTVAEFYPKLADAVQRVNANRYMPATGIIMHPRRWGWLNAAVDTAGRPLVVPNTNGAINAVGVGNAAEYGQVVGTLHGLPVITDANIPTNLGAGTNEDIVIVAKLDDLLLWEQDGGMPRELRFEETNGGNLTVKVVVYGYSAFTAGRYPKSVATIGGTGLVTPTF